MARIPFDPATDYYKLLGVTPAASPEEIQAAYRRLAKAYHPDLHADSTAAATNMARVNVAKSVLLDRETRASYDHLRAARGRPAAAARVAHAATTPPPAGRAAPPAATSGVRYAPQPSAAGRPRHRVGAHMGGRTGRSGLDRQTGILFLIAVPLIAALAMYVFEAVQVSVQAPRQPPADLVLLPNARPTARNAADAVFLLVHAQPPSRDLAVQANNLILARADASPEGETLRADGRRLLRAAQTNDSAAWAEAVADLCLLAGRC
jgi:curved DNA-binding protein CbpA